MSELNTITARFFDGSGKYVRNLNVKSRYAGSSKENLKKTDKLSLKSKHVFFSELV